VAGAVIEEPNVWRSRYIRVGCIFGGYLGPHSSETPQSMSAGGRRLPVPRWLNIRATMRFVVDVGSTPVPATLAIAAGPAATT